MLVDSADAIVASINHALEQNGLPRRQPESLRRFVGPPLSSAFAELAGEAEDSEFVSSCVAAYRERYAGELLEGTSAVPGMDDVLGALAPRLDLALATSKPLVFSERILEAVGLRSYFTVVAGPTLSAVADAKAKTVGEALAALGQPPRAVMVGDRRFDVEGAKAHCLPSIGVTWGLGSLDELKRAGAHQVVRTPGELPPAIARLLGAMPPRQAPSAAGTASGP